jgi:hypothetical protein
MTCFLGSTKSNKSAILIDPVFISQSKASVIFEYHQPLSSSLNVSNQSFALKKLISTQAL